MTDANVSVATPEAPVVKDYSKDSRIVTDLKKNSILVDFCRQYLTVVDKITDYNKEVLAERDADWTPAKILEKARELARPTDKDTKPNEDVKAAIENYEKLVNEFNLARRAVLETTATAIGITLSATAERSPEAEAPLKEQRKLANEIGTQLKFMVDMLNDGNLSTKIEEFLKANPLPAVGRDQARTFGSEEKATPKYRVHVQVTDKDGNIVVSADGFTKAALALTKSYERGKSPKSDVLRAAWEKAGNTPEKTVTSPVEFDDNELHYMIIKK